MEQRLTTKNDGPSAICELNALNRAATLTSTLASTSVLTSTDDGIRSMMMQHRQPMLVGIASNSRSTLFSDAINNQSGAKVQMSLNPRYISKITNSSSRKIVDTSLRMRPYFIPERSRTKSENSVERDSYVGVDGGGGSGAYTCAANNFVAAAINSNSNASMMETCDTMDATANNSASNSSNTSISGFSGISAFNSLHNNATASGGSAAATILNASGRLTNKQTVLQQWKKSKSLEDVRAENIDGSQPSHEMEFVSSRIQKLKVQE